MGHSFFDSYRNFDLWIRKWTGFFLNVPQVFGGIPNLLAMSFFWRILLLYTSSNSYVVSRVIASFFLLGEAMIMNNAFKYKVFVKTI